MPFKMKGSPFHEMESNAQQRENLMKDMPIDGDASTPLNQGTVSNLKTITPNKTMLTTTPAPTSSSAQRKAMREKTLAKRQKEGSTEIDSGSDVGNFLRRVKHNFKKEADAKRGIQSSGGRDGDININTVADTSGKESTDQANYLGDDVGKPAPQPKKNQPGSDAAYEELMS